MIAVGHSRPMRPNWAGRLHSSRCDVHGFRRWKSELCTATTNDLFLGYL